MNKMSSTQIIDGQLCYFLSWKFKGGIDNKKTGIEKYFQFLLLAKQLVSSGTGLLHQFLESLRFMHGNMGQRFTVEFNILFLKAVDKL